MPLHIMIGILALLVALVLYTIATWSAFKVRSIDTGPIVLIWIGFGFDVLATMMMAIQAGGVQNDLHTILAFIGMFGMLAAAVLGSWAKSAAKNNLSRVVSRWVPLPWAVWVFIFVWGMISRGAARIGG